MKKSKEIAEVIENLEPLKLSTQEQRTLLDEKVTNMILAGKSRKQCLKFIAKESKRLGQEHTASHCSNIYFQVKKALNKEFDELKDDLLADITTKMYYLYQQNYENSDYKECRECLKEIAKLAGISGNNKVEIDRPDENIVITFN